MQQSQDQDWHNGWHVDWLALAGDLSERIDDWPAWITVGVIVASAGLAIWSLRDSRRTRYGQLITELSRQWSEPAAVESRGLYGRYKDVEITNLVIQLFGETPSPTPQALKDWGKLSLWANRIEALGVLVDENVISAEVVYKFWGGGILSAWSAWEEAVVELRKGDKEPETFQYFEALAAQMRWIHDENARKRRS